MTRHIENKRLHCQHLRAMSVVNIGKMTLICVKLKCGNFIWWHFRVIEENSVRGGEYSSPGLGRAKDV